MKKENAHLVIRSIFCSPEFDVSKGLMNGIYLAVLNHLLVGRQVQISKSKQTIVRVALHDANPLNVDVLINKKINGANIYLNDNNNEIPKEISGLTSELFKFSFSEMGMQGTAVLNFDVKVKI